MNRSEPIQAILLQLDAPEEFRCGQGQGTFDAVVSTCNLYWLLWYAGAVGLRRECVALACDFADRARYPEWADKNPAVLAVATARRWLLGEATEQDCLDAYRASSTVIGGGAARCAVQSVISSHAAAGAAYLAFCASAYAARLRAEFTHSAPYAQVVADEPAWQLERARSVLTPELLWPATARKLEEIQRRRAASNHPDYADATQSNGPAAALTT